MASHITHSTSSDPISYFVSWPASPYPSFGPSSLDPLPHAPGYGGHLADLSISLPTCIAAYTPLSSSGSTNNKATWTTLRLPEDDCKAHASLYTQTRISSSLRLRISSTGRPTVSRLEVNFLRGATGLRSAICIFSQIAWR